MRNLTHRTIRSACILAATVALSLGQAACNDALWDAAWDDRQKNLHGVYDRWVKSEEVRPMNLAELDQTSRELQELYAERLQWTLEAVHNKAQRDVENWHHIAPIRAEQIGEMMRGNPENIPENWAKMVY